MELTHAFCFLCETEGGVGVSCHAVGVRGGLVAAGLANGLVALWRPKGGRARLESKPLLLRGHSGVILGLLFVEEPGLGGEGALLLSWSADRTIRIWDPHTAACAQTLRAHGGGVSSVVYSSGCLISASTDKTIRLWRAEAGRELMLYPWYSAEETLRDIQGWVGALAIHVPAEGGALYAGDEHGTISVYKASVRHAEGLQLKRWRRQPQAHALGITRLLLVPSHHTVVSTSYDCTVKLFDTRNGGVLLSIDNGHKVRYNALAWVEAKAELVLADELGYVYFWDVQSERCLKTEKLVGPDAIPREAAAKVHAVLATAAKAKATDSGMAAPAASGSVARGVRMLAYEGDLLYTSSGTTVDAWLVMRDVKAAETAGHTGPIVSLATAEPPSMPRHEGDPSVDRAASSGQAVLYSASLDGTIRAWDVLDMSCLQVLEETRSEIACLCHSSLCDMLLTGHDDGSIRIWNVDTGSTITLRGHENTVLCLCVVAKNASQLMLLSSGFDGQVGMWDITKHKNALPRLEHLVKASDEEVLAMIVNPMAAQYITAGNDTLVRVWSVRTQAALATLRGHSDAISCLALDGNFLFSASEGGDVRLWDLHSFGALSTLRAHDGPVSGMLIVPDSGWLVTCGSTDHCVRVWDYGAGNELKTWNHTDSFRCIALKRSISHIVAGTEEHNLVSFPLSEVSDKIRARKEAAEEEAREAERAAQKAAQLAAVVADKRAAAERGAPADAGAVVASAMLRKT